MWTVVVGVLMLVLAVVVVGLVVVAAVVHARMNISNY